MVLLGCGQKSEVLARATTDCQGFSDKYASAGDLAGMGMRMLMEMEVPEKKDNMWCSTGVNMLNEVSAAGFPGHSEKATMPSILAALGVSKADRDMMGRWSPKGSEEDIRTYRVVIKAVTDKFMDAIRHGDIYETLDEEEVMQGMVVKLVKRRFDEETAKKEVAKVGIFERRSAGSFPLENKGRESLWASGHRSEKESWLKNMKRRTSRRRRT